MAKKTDDVAIPNLVPIEGKIDTTGMHKGFVLQLQQTRFHRDSLKKGAILTYPVKVGDVQSQQSAVYDGDTWKLHEKSKTVAQLAGESVEDGSDLRVQLNKDAEEKAELEEQLKAVQKELAALKAKGGN